MARAHEQDWGHATELDDVSGEVAIAGIGEAEYSKGSGRTARDLATEAAERAIADAGLTPEQVDGLTYSGGFPDFDAAAFHEHFGTSHELFESGDGGGMAWAATAPYVAAQAIRAGKAKHVLNVFSVAWATERSQMTGGPGEKHAENALKANLEIPFGWFPQPVYFATITRRHMHEFGTTPEQLGDVAVACRRHAQLNETALMRGRPLSLDDYLARPMLVDPLRVEDCCLISDGGAAFVTTSVDRARDLARPPVVVAGVGEGISHTRSFWAQQPAFTSTPQVFAAPGAFAMAGVSPGDVDVLTAYDPFTIVALMQIEDMGFCEKGEGGPFVEGGRLFHDGGGLPYNTHGGLLSHAYVLGIAHVVEVVKQLRGDAGAAQVRDPEVGVYAGYSGPTATTLILRRDH